MTTVYAEAAANPLPHHHVELTVKGGGVERQTFHTPAEARLAKRRLVDAGHNVRRIQIVACDPASGHCPLAPLGGAP